MENLWNNLKKEFKNHLDKNGFDRVVLGLSGGLDSAIVALLASEVLGGNNVRAIMMKTKYTSDLSLNIAQKIAKNCKLCYSEIDIDKLIEFETKILENVFGENVKGIVVENLQARVRGQILMAYSNQFGDMVLGCSNKSEIHTGYCTLYGDVCGGLLPIGNIYKSEIFKLAKWLNRNEERLPKEVIDRAPSAELCYNQRDENTLPPYYILDEILMHIVDGKKLQNCFKKELINSVLELNRRSYFKRKQLPPILLL
ncbi:MAG: NAD(+) synthase [Alphaproteobacteria bacterium]|nr:NAD(+) synthase [Alphaproteobacteria bacterium]